MSNSSRERWAWPVKFIGSSSAGLAGLCWRRWLLGEQQERNINGISCSAGALSPLLVVPEVAVHVCRQVSGQLLVGRSLLKSVPSLLSLLITVLDKSEGRPGLGGRVEGKQL